MVPDHFPTQTDDGKFNSEADNERGACLFKENGFVALTFDWLVWVFIFKPKEANIGAILFI